MFTDNSLGMYDITQVMELLVFDSAYGLSSEAVRCSLNMWHRGAELLALNCVRRTVKRFINEIFSVSIS